MITGFYQLLLVYLYSGEYSNMSNLCRACEETIGPKELEKGECYSCGYTFNPKQRDWEREFPKLYEGAITILSGESVSIVKMAEQLLSERILARFGLFAVTSFGIECLSHSYSIPNHRLEEDDWIDHMAAKTWVNIDDFKAALHYAKRLADS